MSTANEFKAVKSAYDKMTDNGFDKLVSSSVPMFNSEISKTGYSVKETADGFCIASDFKKSSLYAEELVRGNFLNADDAAYGLIKALEKKYLSLFIFPVYILSRI